MKMLIGGKMVGSEQGAGNMLDIVNPATGEKIDSVPDGGAMDIAAAVDAASRQPGDCPGAVSRTRCRPFRRRPRPHQEGPAIPFLKPLPVATDVRQTADRLRATTIQRTAS